MYFIDTDCYYPVNLKPYLAASQERNIMSDEVTKMLQKNIIIKSETPWAFPVAWGDKMTAPAIFTMIAGSLIFLQGRIFLLFHE